MKSVFAPVLFLSFAVASGAYAASVRNVVERFQSSSSSCKIYKNALETDDPVGAHPAETVSFYGYMPKKPGPYSGAVLIHPPTGGITWLDRHYAEAFCDQGIDVFLLDTWGGYSEPGAYDFGTHDRAAAHAIAATEAVISFIDRPVALLGESVGAIFSSMVLGRDHQRNSASARKVRAAVLVVGGSPLVDVVAESDQEALVGLRKKRMKAFGISSPQEYRKRLVESVKIEPAEHADPSRAADLLLVIATLDSTVPTENQRKLWEAWGRPAYRTINLGHVPAIIATYFFHRKEITSFILSKMRR